MVRKSNGIPTFDDLMNPILIALKDLGGSASLSELNEKVIEILNLPESITSIPHKEGRSGSKVAYRLAWALTYLKKYGMIGNSTRGIWSLTKHGHKVQNVDQKRVIKQVRSADTSLKLSQKNIEEDENEAWQNQLQSILLNMSPSSFERLAQRLLRELGFIKVEVLGKSGDGGIDGKGILKINNILSFHIFFQCKRYSAAIRAGQIRDFRGAMQGRADKGMFITTSYFTPSAIDEANREGAPPIDLVDGELLKQQLKELSLGLKTKTVEEIEIDKEWFENL